MDEKPAANEVSRNGRNGRMSRNGLLFFPQHIYLFFADKKTISCRK